MASNVGLLASQNPLLAYFIIYIVTIFLGNISAFASFWLIFQGYLGQWGIPFLILTIFSANLTGDLLWYSLGRITRDTRFGNWIKRRLPWHVKIEQALSRNGRRWMLLSKLLYGSSFPIVFTVGWAKMPFKKFFRNSLLSVVVWLPILIGLAYALVSGLSPLRAIAAFDDFELVFFVGLALFIFMNYFVAKILARILARRGEG